ncbi:hypothetical protein VNO80_15930 [Phaseolus coccineus]|uniref:Uncharacterized protein n=1 Tax=Phaseolus coccineus TaxID=3886 RepID=A0AAN9MKS0_PHACN
MAHLELSIPWHGSTEQPRHPTYLKVSSGFTPLKHSSPSFRSQQTPWSVFQEGPNGKPTGRRPERARAETPHEARVAIQNRNDDVSTSISTTRAWATSAIRVDQCASRSADRLTPFHIRPRHIVGPHPLPSQKFQALFDSLFKVLFIFPSWYLFAIDLSPVFSLGWNLLPDWSCISKQPDSVTAPHGAIRTEHNGALTLSRAPFQGTWARSATKDASPDYNSNAEGDRFSWWAFPISLAVTKGILVSFFSSAY